MRNLTIYSSTKNFRPTSIETNATSWGELKPELSSQGLLPSDYNAVDGETKLGFTNDEALIPEDGGEIWISAAKVKSGQQIYKNPETGRFCSKEEYEKYQQIKKPAKRSLFDIMNDLDEEISDFEDDLVRDTSIGELFDELAEHLLGEEEPPQEAMQEEDVNEEAKKFFENL